jgi:SAM-dependent methyltransferase
MNSEMTPGSSLKNFIKGIPVIGPTVEKIAQLPVFLRARNLAFPGSTSFWESVYRNGGTSGPGSYGRLAVFKAEILNEFVQAKNIQSVIEFGCGDGAQLQLANYPQYVGVDVATVSVAHCSSLFASDSTKRFYRVDALPTDIGKFDLAMSLDVIYHLVENSVFDTYMRRLFDSSQRYVAIYSSNYDALTQAPHVRHRKFTTWIAKNARDWQGAGFVSNRFPADPTQPEETSFADFHFFAHKDAVSG